MEKADMSEITDVVQCCKIDPVSEHVSQDLRCNKLCMQICIVYNRQYSGAAEFTQTNQSLGCSVLVCTI